MKVRGKYENKNNIKTKDTAMPFYDLAIQHITM